MKYEVNASTLAILPDKCGKSRIIEKENEYLIEDKPYKIMEHSCEYFGSSIEGRICGTKNMLGSIYKPPLLIEESKKIIFFPTESPNTDNNIWISLNNIKEYNKQDHKTIIKFKNNKEIVLDIPYYSIDNQILRATRLQTVYFDRKND